MCNYIYYLFLTVLVLIFLGGIGSLLAVPAYPEPFTAKQPDGSEFKVCLKGDEWINWSETVDGHPIIIDKQTGFWEYAKIEPLIGLSPTGQIVGKELPVGINKISAKELRPFRSPDVKRAGSSGGSFSSSGPPQLAPLNILGTRKLLAILVNFTDRSLTTTEAGWASRIFTDTNSVKQYYSEVSYNQLTIAPAEETFNTASDGIVAVTLGYAHPDTGAFVDQRNQQLTKDAIIAADSFVNFASFDTDGNGQITTNELHIMIIVAGFERAYVPYGTPSVWAHKWSIDGAVSAPVADGKTVGGYPGGYTQFGELHGTELDNHQATIGVVIHELGHDMGTATVPVGLIDFYDTDSSSNGIGRWDSMAIGEWNVITQAGDTPAHFSAWCKWYLGWITPTQITVLTSGILFPQVEDAAGLDRGIKQILDNPNGPEMGGTGEYFLLENRQKTGYDAALPGAGLLIWHIDETQSSNANEARKLVDLEESDGLNQLDNKTNKGDAGDPYPGTSVNRAFNNTSNPNSKLYSGADTNLGVSNISDSAATMTADIINSIDRPPVLISPGDRIIIANQLLTFTLSASDPDTDTITYSMASTPTGATLDSVTGVFNWMPITDQVGTYNLTFSAIANNLSDSKAITIIVVTLPSAPSDLAGDTFSLFMIKLTWTDTSFNEDGFKIERSSDNINFSQLSVVGSNVTSYLDRDIFVGTTYYYRVKAFNIGGDSDYSNTISAKTLQAESGSSKSKKKNKCGCLGIEAVIFIFLVRLIRRRKSSIQKHRATI